MTQFPVRFEWKRRQYELDHVGYYRDGSPILEVRRVEGVDPAPYTLSACLDPLRGAGEFALRAEPIAHAMARALIEAGILVKTGDELPIQGQFSVPVLRRAGD